MDLIKHPDGYYYHPSAEIGEGTHINRDFVGIEINPEYINMAEKRLSAVQSKIPLI